MQPLSLERRTALEQYGFQIIELGYDDPVAKTDRFLTFNGHTFADYDTYGDVPYDLPDGYEFTVDLNSLAPEIQEELCRWYACEGGAEFEQALSEHALDDWMDRAYVGHLAVGGAGYPTLGLGLAIALLIMAVVILAVTILNRFKSDGGGAVEPPCGETGYEEWIDDCIKYIVYPNCAGIVYDTCTGEILDQFAPPQQKIPYTIIIIGIIAVGALYYLSSRQKTSREYAYSPREPPKRWF